MMRAVFQFVVLSLCLTRAAVAWGAAFALTDSDPDSPEFRRRFMASYGVNEAIEPKLTPADRPLQEAIIPHIRDNPRKAIEFIEKALGPKTNPAFYSILGNLYYQVNEFGMAERALRQAIGAFPSLRRAWRTLALTYVQRSSFQEAVIPLLKVIELGGGDAQSYGLLAYSYLNLEKYEASLSAYRMARLFKPDSVDFRRGQARCLQETGQYRLAVALLDELLEERPEILDFWLAQANAFLELDQPNDAIANLQIVADAGMASWESRILLGDLLLNRGLESLALKTYMSAFREQGPRREAGALHPLKQLVASGLYPEARSYLNLIRPTIPEGLNDGSRRVLSLAEARIEMSVGDPQKALDWLGQLLEEDPLDGESLLMLGQYYRTRKEFGQAEFYFERLLSLRDFAARGHVELGRLEVDQGRLREALITLRKAQALDPDPNVREYMEAIEAALKTGP